MHKKFFSFLSILFLLAFLVGCADALFLLSDTIGGINEALTGPNSAQNYDINTQNYDTDTYDTKNGTNYTHSPHVVGCIRKDDPRTSCLK